MNKLLIVIMFILYIHPAWADPSESISYLMNEPMTMFEWGNYKLEKFFDTEIQSDIIFKEFDPSSKDISVKYNWERNIIVVIADMTLKNEFIKSNDPRFISKKCIENIKARFNYDSKGKRIFVESAFHSLLTVARFYQHTNFTNKNKPKTLEKDIENSIRIKVKIRTKNNVGHYPVLISSESNLTDDEYFYTLSELKPDEKSK